MLTPIIPHVLPVVLKLFPSSPNQQEAIQLLQKQCGRNLPDCADENPMTPILRNIRFAALKMSGGDIAKLREAMALANKDWRILLVQAGFNDESASELWAKQLTAEK